MSISYNPRIVTDGLVLALDVANTKSYTGSGTNWTNLIGSVNNGTLTYGPYYTSVSGGSIGFDGSDDNVILGTSGFSFGSSAGTLSAWAKTVDTNGTRTIVSYGNAATNQARFLGIGANNFYFGGYNSNISASGLSYDTWFNLVGVYNGTQASMYVNGVLVAGPTLQSWNTQANNAGVGKNVNNGEYWSGDVAQVSVYNKALSAAEIQQNYNALKNRYVNYRPGDTPIITVSVSPSSTLEDGVTNLVYTFTSNKIVTDAVTINYTIGGNATNGVDYLSIPNSVTILSGNSTATVTVNPTTDYASENNETVTLTITGGGPYIIGSPSSATGTITNDDNWIATLVGANTEEGRGIAVDGSGNVYITGYTDGENGGAIVAKYNPYGSLVWHKIIDGIFSQLAADGKGIAVDSSGYVYIAATTNNYDALILKYDTNGTIVWQKTLSGTGNEFGVGIAVDGPGNVYVTGHTTSAGAGGQDVLITKYNTDGANLWQRALGGVNTEDGNGIAVDSYGNVYITGTTYGVSGSNADILIAKYDTSGTFQWQRTLGNSSGFIADNGYDIAVDGSGNVYITGRFNSGSGVFNVLIAKYNTDGLYRWQKSLRSDFGRGIAADSSGNVYVTGSDGLIAKYDTDGIIQWKRSLSSLDGQSIAVDSSGNVYVTGNNSGDVLIAKLPADGSFIGTYGAYTYATSSFTEATPTLTSSTSSLTSAPPKSYWIATVGGSTYSGGSGIAVDGSGDVYIVGGVNGATFSSGVFFIAKYNSSGIIQWQKSLGSTNSAGPTDIVADSSGNVYVTGADNITGGQNVLIAKYNAATGANSWQRTLGADFADFGYGIAVDSSGYVYVVGATSTPGSGTGDAVIIAKYSSSGENSWKVTLGGVGVDRGRGIAVDGSGYVYITGSIYSGSIRGALIAKYNSSGQIQWQRTYPTDGDGGYNIAVDGSGNVYTIGSNSNIVKYNSSGISIWARSLGIGSEVGYIAVDGSGNVYAAGSTIIAKYNTDGANLWQRSLTVSFGLDINGIAVYNDKVHVTGMVNTSSGGSSTKIFTAILPADGSLTGTYGTFTYATESFSPSPVTITTVGSPLAAASSPATSSALSLTDSSLSLTSSVTTITATPITSATPSPLFTSVTPSPELTSSVTYIR